MILLQLATWFYYRVENEKRIYIDCIKRMKTGRREDKINIACLIIVKTMSFSQYISATYIHKMLVDWINQMNRIIRIVATFFFYCKSSYFFFFSLFRANTNTHVMYIAYSLNWLHSNWGFNQFNKAAMTDFFLS